MVDHRCQIHLVGLGKRREQAGRCKVERAELDDRGLSGFKSINDGMGCVAADNRSLIGGKFRGGLGVGVAIRSDGDGNGVFDVAAGAEDLGPEPEALHHRLLLILGKLPGRISRVCIVGVLLIALALIVEVEFKKGPARIVVGVAGFERLSRCRAQQRGRSAGDKRRTPCGSVRRLLLNVVFDEVAIFDTEHDHQR